MLSHFLSVVNIIRVNKISRFDYIKEIDSLNILAVLKLNKSTFQNNCFEV